MNLKSFLLFLLPLVFAPLLGLAQNLRENLSFGINNGVVISRSSNLDIFDGTNKQRLNNGLSYYGSFAVSYTLDDFPSKILQKSRVVLEAGFLSKRFDDSLIRTRQNQYLLMINGIVSHNLGYFRPYGGLGLGLNNFRQSYQVRNIESIQKNSETYSLSKSNSRLLAYQMIVGCETEVLNKTTVGVEYRYLGTNKVKFDVFTLEQNAAGKFVNLSSGNGNHIIVLAARFRV